MIRVAINGLGRIGRAFMRQAVDDPDVEIVAVNDLVDADDLAYLLQYDSVHGTFGHPVTVRGDRLLVDDNPIRTFRSRHPATLPWRRLHVDVVIEATGTIRTARKAFAAHQLTGAAKVIITANPLDRNPASTPVLVMGVNERSYAGEAVVSAGSCSTNAAGAVIRVMHEAFAVRAASLTAVHAYTPDQCLLDAAHPRDRRRGRAAALNVVPSESDAAQMLARIMPELVGNIAGMAVRVPVADGSLMNVLLQVERPADEDAIHAAVRENANGKLAGILGYCDAAWVSRDVLNDTHSAVYDALLTETVSDTLFRICCWYDHEWGYAARLLDLTKHITQCTAASTG